MAPAFAAAAATLSCSTRLHLAPRSIQIKARLGGGGNDSSSTTAGGINRPNLVKPPAAASATHHQAAPCLLSTSTGPIHAIHVNAAPSAAGEVMVPLSALSTFFSKASLAELDVLLLEVTSSLALPTDQLPAQSHGRAGVQQRQQVLGSVSMDDRGVIRQRFVIPSYEIGADRTASIETLMKYLQEISLNQASMAGILADGFGRTFEMCKRGLIWAVTKIQIQIERFPCWGDDVEVESWIAESGKNGKRRDWVIRDRSTGQILTKATSVWVMMNKETRKLSKMPEEVRKELQPLFVNERPCALDADITRVPKLHADEADYAFHGLTPGWGDLDVNQHVNNVKYIGWIFESVPVSLLETHQMVGMTLEYRKECGRDSILSSLTKEVAQGSLEVGSSELLVVCHHLLQLDNGKSEILRGKTQWRPKKH